MNVRKAFVAQLVLNYIVMILFIPFGVGYILFRLLFRMFETLMDCRDYLYHYIGHKMFLLTKEKEIVKNPDYYDVMTAEDLYDFLKKEGKL